MEEQNYGCFLWPSSYNSGRNHAFSSETYDPEKPLDSLRGQYRYTVKEVEDFAAKFSELERKTLEVFRLAGKENGVPRAVSEHIQAIMQKSQSPPAAPSKQQVA